MQLKSIWLVVGWCGVVAVTYLSLTPRPLSLPIEQGDKLQHFAAYGALMLWFAQLYVLRASRRVLAALLIVMGVGLEFGQLLVEGRQFSVVDMAANVTGTAIGWLLAPPRTKNVFASLLSYRTGKIK